MIDPSDHKPETVSHKEWLETKCDKYDYMIAASCGALAGLVDVLFVGGFDGKGIGGNKSNSLLGKAADNTADNLVIKVAGVYWTIDSKKGKPKKKPENLVQSISYLERTFRIGYDARYAKDLRVKTDVLADMSPTNHHIMSLAHCPDPIGLVFSIIDQFTGKASFVNDGKIIRVVPKKTDGVIPYLQGNNLPSKLFCGFVNWLGHLMSDLVGSSSTRRKTVAKVIPGTVPKNGRGAGIPIPFYELFLFCDFTGADGKKVSDIMIDVFEQGYDARFGMAMAVPVLLEELFIRAIWVLRRKFGYKLPWSKCLPTKEHADLRIMLLVGNSTLCLVDGIDAGIRGITQGNIVSFICHLNLIGWARLTMLVLQEMVLDDGIIRKKLTLFINDILNAATLEEKRLIIEFKYQLELFEKEQDRLFKMFMEQIEAEYEELYREIEATFDTDNSIEDRAQHSVAMAQLAGVSEDKIIHNLDELDELFL